MSVVTRAATDLDDATTAMRGRGLLVVEGVVAGYSAADEVLKGVDLRVDEGEIVCIIGPNGAG
ncbi:MAG TPA: ABC transporter ATP-binding protein, partial [Casimicrobiaceae bacterium]|nr:ABC transporter ATP-binding protein [Casimicrobiaceae bacterium]